MKAGGLGVLGVGSGGGGSGVCVKSLWTNSRRWLRRFDEAMLQTSVVLSRRHVIDGESLPVDRLMKMPRQCGGPWAN